MVDASASFGGGRPGTIKGACRTSPDGIVATAYPSATREALRDYEQFCRTALYSPPQSALWVRHWVETTDPDAVLAIASLDGRPLLALALEVVPSGPFRIARFMGGGHANGNFAATDATRPGPVTLGAVMHLLAAIGAVRPDIDLVALQRLLPDLDGLANPFAGLPSSPSPNISLAVGLGDGFDAVLARSSGKRKRKKNRSQTRKFEAAGGLRRIEANDPAQVRRLLDAFFAMKESRFRRMGIANVFGEAKVRSFFHALFSGAQAQKDPPFLLHGLEVAGELRAVTGSSRSGKRLICEFGSISEDELSSASPGDFLFFANIEEACRHGLEVYDFSVGDEPYKRQWCDIETQHLDVLAPLTLKGRLLALALRGNSRLKAHVKNSPAIWRLTKMLRRRAMGQKPETTPETTDE